MIKGILFQTLAFLCFLQNVSSQLHFGAGTRIAVSSDTYIVLDNLSFKYDADPMLLSNIFRFTGSSDVTISGKTRPVFKVIEVDKTGSGKIILLRNIDVSEAVIFHSGLFDLNNQNVYLSSAAKVIGEKESSRFIGSNGGFISINAVLDAPSYVNPGNLGAIFTTSRNMGNVSIKRGHQAQVDQRISQSGILRYFDINATNNANLNVTFQFSYFDSELNNNNKERLKIRSRTTNQIWTDDGSASRQSASNKQEKAGIQSFSRLTLIEPPRLLSVGAKVNNSLPQKINDAKTFIIQTYPTQVVNNALYIRTGNADIQEMLVRVFDGQGRLLLTRQLSYQSQWLNLPILNGGVFRIVIQSDKQEYSTFFLK